jgi:hypothetical protein
MLLGAGLLLSLLAAGWVMSNDIAAPDVQPVAKPARRDARGPAAAAAPAAAEPLQIDRLKRETPAVSETVADVFAGKSWYVAPPPPPPAPPPKPTAPPLPFSFFGKMVDDGRVTVMVASKDRSYAVKVGDTIDGTYRVDEISPSAMILTYLPLNEQQTLALGSP